MYSVVASSLYLRNSCHRTSFKNNRSLAIVALSRQISSGLVFLFQGKRRTKSKRVASTAFQFSERILLSCDSKVKRWLFYVLISACRFQKVKFQFTVRRLKLLLIFCSKRRNIFHICTKMNGYTDLTKMESNRNNLRRIACHDEQTFSKESIVYVMENFVKTVNIMDETILVPCRLMDRQVGDSNDQFPAPPKDLTVNQMTLNTTCKLNGKRAPASKNVHEFLSSAKLFNLYNMLNAVKNDLLWTGNDVVDDEDFGPDVVAKEDDEGSTANAAGAEAPADLENSQREQQQNVLLADVSDPVSTADASNTTTNVVKGHNRRPSNASLTSTTSVSNMSDSESEISNENDSGIESEGHSGTSQTNKSNSTKSSTTSSSSIGADKATDLARQCRLHLSGLYQCLEQMTEAANYLTARYQCDIGPV